MPYREKTIYETQEGPIIGQLILQTETNVYAEHQQG